jgi:uncharacterized RDD family membrane protein YckC
VLDGLVIGVPFFIIQIIVSSHFSHVHTITTATSVTTTETTSGAAAAVLYLSFLAVSGLYFTLFNGRGRGQTPGNRAPRIAVRDVNTGETIGARRGFVRWLVRTLLYIAFVLPGIVNDLFPLWDARRQTLADKAARSVMIRV